MAEGRRAFDAADYRWAVQVLHHLVFADPDNIEAKNLQADAYEQLGYQQEIPQWRGIFLTAAMELRNGVHNEGGLGTATQDTILGMPMNLLLDFAAVHIVGPAAADADIRINITVAGPGGEDEQWNLWVAHGVLNARPGHAADAQLSITGPKPAIVGLILQPAKSADLLASGAITSDGDTTALRRLAAVMEEFNPAFNLATP
jgi:alkyl sulfatase BDS1-like metallo-beta-lactamase superfamily hydrolase